MSETRTCGANGFRGSIQESADKIVTTVGADHHPGTFFERTMFRIPAGHSANIASFKQEPFRLPSFMNADTGASPPASPALIDSRGASPRNRSFFVIGIAARKRSAVQAGDLHSMHGEGIQAQQRAGQSLLFQPTRCLRMRNSPQIFSRGKSGIQDLHGIAFAGQQERYRKFRRGRRREQEGHKTCVFVFLLHEFGRLPFDHGSY